MGRIDVQAVIGACRLGADVDELLRHAVAALRRLVPFDACGVRLADPDTMLWTGAYVEGPAAITWRFIENELLDDDFLKFSTLARGPLVGTLDAATGGDLTRSRRYRTILAPAGLGDELRAALVAGETCWGTLCLSRRRQLGTFTTEERDVVGTAAPALGQAIAHALLASRTIVIPQGPPGTLFLRADDTILGATAPAQQWLARLAPIATGELPPVVRAVVARARAAAAGAAGGAASARARGRDGSWFELHAAPLLDEPTTITLTIAPAPVGRIAPLLLASFDLSPRERDVLVLLLRGLSTEQIARHLFISRHTVRDHTKAIFAKANVTSRPELVARVLATAEASIA